MEKRAPEILGHESTSVAAQAGLPVAVSGPRP